MNPLMQSMGMIPQMNRMQSAMQQVNNIKKIMSGKDPNAIMAMLTRQNPQFAQFVQANQGKSPEQIANENGLDWNMVKGFLK